VESGISVFSSKCSDINRNWLRSFVSEKQAKRLLGPYGLRGLGHSSIGNFFRGLRYQGGHVEPSLEYELKVYSLIRLYILVSPCIIMQGFLLCYKT